MDIVAGSIISFLPIDPDFYNPAQPPISGSGGLLPIVPVFGGSGPQTLAQFTVSLALGAEVKHGALNLSVPAPATGPTTYVVGAPEVTLTYSGLGTSRNVYAQLVDNETHRVVGNIVSPIPVTLDGKEHTYTASMEAIAYTMNPGSKGLTLQIFDSATSFENFTSFGVINVSQVGLTLPSAKDVIQLEMPDTAGVG